MNNLLRFRTEGKVNLAAVCDVDENHLEPAVNAAGEGVKSYRDYRRVLERPDIDAVVIATPDHWHAVQVGAQARTAKGGWHTCRAIRIRWRRGLDAGGGW